MSEEHNRLRLHPATLAIGALRRLPELVFALPAAAYFVGDMDLFVAVIIAAVGFVLSVGISTITWLRFSYVLADEQLIIESGLLSRNRRTIPFDRIQDVSLEQSLLARIFGVSIVRIETGSSGSDEGKLECVSGEEANHLRDVIRQHRSEQVGAAIEPAADEKAAPLLFKMDVDRLLVAGIFNFSLVFLAIIGAAWQYLGAYLPVRFVDPEYWLGEGEALLGMVSMAAAGFVLGALLLVGVISGIIRTFLRDYGFRLTRTETGFRRTRGLFTRTDVVMPIQRVQAAIVSTGIVRRYFGWQKLALQSLGTDGGHGTNHDAAPFARHEELAPVLNELSLPLPPEKNEYKSVSQLLIVRSIIEDIVLLAIIVAILMQFWSSGYWLLLAVPIVIVAPVFEYLAHGYRIDDGLLFVRAGWWRPKVTVLPLPKIQTVTLRINLLQRLFGLASVYAGTAGASLGSPLRIVDLPDAEARRLMDAHLLEYSDENVFGRGF